MLITAFLRARWNVHKMLLILKGIHNPLHSKNNSKLSSVYTGDYYVFKVKDIKKLIHMYIKKKKWKNLTFGYQ